MRVLPGVVGAGRCRRLTGAGLVLAAAAALAGCSQFDAALGQRQAVVSSVPVLKAVAFSVPAEPRSLVKKPSFRPTRAEAWVMFVRKPSLTVTGEPPPDPPDPEAAGSDDEDEDEQPAASRRAAPTATAAMTRRI